MRLLLLLVSLIALSSCNVNSNLLFTYEQFPEIKSNEFIPSDWHGSWDEYDSSYFNAYITKDSLKIDGFEYKINSSKLDITEDSLDDFDKLIIDKDWCFLEIYEKSDSIPFLSGYRIFVAKKDNKGTISCWALNYEYFLKHQLINILPVLKYENVNLTSDGRIQKLQLNSTYIELPEGISIFRYRKILNGLAIDPGKPLFCSSILDTTFFKKVVLSTEPDYILNSDKTIVKRSKYRFEKKLYKNSEKNLRSDFIKKIEQDF